jgi:hypothetical protein
MDQPTAEKALRELDILVGEWAVKATWPSGESWPGRATFEWLDSGRLLLVRGSLEHPEAPDYVAVIGCDAANGTYYQLYTDERDVCRVVQMAIGGGELRFWRDGEPFSQRFNATFSDDGNTLTGYWELAEDGKTFAKDFDMVYERVSASSSGRGLTDPGRTNLP